MSSERRLLVSLGCRSPRLLVTLVACYPAAVAARIPRQGLLEARGRGCGPRGSRAGAARGAPVAAASARHGARVRRLNEAPAWAERSVSAGGGPCLSRAWTWSMCAGQRSTREGWIRLAAVAVD